MQKRLLFLLPFILFAGAADAQNFILHIKNSAHTELTYSFDIDHGMKGMLPGTIAADEEKTIYFNPDVLTGVEGYVRIYPTGQPGDRADIYYDNPLIGTATYAIWSSPSLHIKPLKWEVLQNKGGDGELFVELTSPGSQYGKAIAISYNSSCTVRGSVFWNQGDIQGPLVSPAYNAFTFRVLAPSQFVESNGPFTLEKTGTYNGKKGFFQGSKQVGTVQVEAVPSFNPNYVELRYTISGVPSGIPLELDVVTDNRSAGWQSGPNKPKPGDDYVFVVGTFPSTVKTAITIDPNLAQLNGADFSCEGDWVKLDGNGALTGGGTMVNKIAARKSSVVLPGNGAIVLNQATLQASPAAQPAAQQNKAQTMQVQKVRTAGAVKIRQ